MAVWALLANAPLSTPGAAWKRVEAQQLDINLTGLNYDDLNTPRNIAVTFANNGNQQGIVLYLRKPGSGTLTIKLQENVASVWTDRTTDTFLLDGSYNGVILKYFSLTSYAVTTAGSTWRYQISFSASGQCYLWRTTTAGQYLYAVVLDTSSAGPSSGDTVIVTDSYTLTIDQTFTFGSTNSTSALICENATITWENPPAVAYTLTINGKIVIGSRSNFVVGTQASPIPVAQRATIDLSSFSPGSSIFGLFCSPSYTFVTDSDAIISLWGAEDSYLFTRVAQDASSGQADVITADDMSAQWQVGDSVTLYGKNQVSVDTSAYTINNIVGTTITLSGNINNTVLVGGAIANLNRKNNLGIWITGYTGSSSICSNGGGLDVLDAVGIYIELMGIGYSIYLNHAARNSVVRSVIYYKNNNNNTSAIVIEKGDGLTFQDFVVYHLGTSFAYGERLVVTNANLSGIIAKNFNTTFGAFFFSGNNCTLSDIVHSNQVNLAGYLLSRLGGSGNTLNDVAFVGADIVCRFGMSASTLVTFRINGGVTYNLYLDSCINTKVTSGYIGSQATATYDIYAITDAYVSLIFYGSYLGAGSVNNMSGAVLGSYILFHEYETTANDHRGWWNYGETQSVGDGLADTTRHTTGSGKFAMRFKPTSSANPLEWIFNVPTGDISAKTMSIICRVRINKEAYWAGTYQLPRLLINYDDGTLQSTTASQIAGDTLGYTEEEKWQLLAVNFTPATSFGQVVVTIDGYTDATGTDAYYYVDDFALLYPAGYALNLGGMDLFADALPVVPPISTIFSAQDIWNAQTVVMTGVGTIGKRVVDNLDAPISGLPTAAQIRAEMDSNSVDLDAIIAYVDELESRLTAARAALLDNLVNLDAAMTSRLSAAGYTAPDNAGITDIQGRLPSALDTGRMVAKAEVVSDKADYSLSNAGIDALWTRVLAESYAAAGAEFTPAQAMYAFMQFLTEKDVSGTTVTVKKLDQSTVAMTFTLDDDTNPTSITRTT